MLASRSFQEQTFTPDNVLVHASAQRFGMVDRYRWPAGAAGGLYEHLVDVLENVSDGIVARDSNGRVIFLNAAARGIFGDVDARECQQTSSEQDIELFDIRSVHGRLLTPQDLPSVQLLAGKTPSRLLASIRQLRTGARLWVTIQAQPLFDSMGTIQCVVSTVQDVTEHYHSSQSQRILRQVDDLIATEPSSTPPLMHAGLERVLSGFFNATCTISVQADPVDDDSGSVPFMADVEQHYDSQVTKVRNVADHMQLDMGKQQKFESGVFADPSALYPRETCVDPNVNTSCLAIPLCHQGSMLGTMHVVRGYLVIPFDHQDLELLQQVAERLARAIAYTRLQQSLNARQRLLDDAIQQLATIEDDERRHLALSLHDGLAQVATATYQHLEAFAHHVAADPAIDRTDLVRAQELSRRTIREARHLIAELRPTVLEHFGLVTALQADIDDLRRWGWDIELENSVGDERFPLRVERDLFRVAQEALANIQKHAGQTSVRVSLSHQGGRLRIDIRDHGTGFDTGTVWALQGGREHVGLAGMKERLALLGGVVVIQSWLGAGTRITAELPL